MLERFTSLGIHRLWKRMAVELAGVFSATTLGLFSGYGFAEGITSIAGQVKVQFIGVAATVTYTAIASFILLKLAGLLTNGIRVSEEQEIQGLDIHMHEERGYDL